MSEQKGRWGLSRQTVTARHVGHVMPLHRTGASRECQRERPARARRGGSPCVHPAGFEMEAGNADPGPRQ